MAKRPVLWMILLLALVLLATPTVYAEDLDTVYETPPDVANCDPGVLATTEKEAVLAYVNEIRARHGLAEVTYDDASDVETAGAALIIVASNSMSHHPPATAACYSEAGATGSGSSNLAWGSPMNGYDNPLLPPSTADIRGWLIDDNVPSLGHRRWLLNPFLQKISYGRVDGPPFGTAPTQVAHGAALKVIYADAAPLPASTPEFVAYPYGDYPLDLFKIGWYWSFSVVADHTSVWGSQDVDFSNATVRVRSTDGDLPVHSISHNNNGAGLPNHLQWRVDGTQMDEPYTVEIENVLVAGELRSYAYPVMLTTPLYSNVDAPVYEVGAEREPIEIHSGETIGLLSLPPVTLSNRYAYTRRGMEIQNVWVSPYLTLLRALGVIGDEIRLEQGGTQTTLRITAPANGDSATALAEELNVPVHCVAGRGEVIEIGGPTRIAVFVQPAADGQGMRSVRWTYNTGMKLSAEFFNNHTLILDVTRGEPGMGATFEVGQGRSFRVEIGDAPTVGPEACVG